MKWKLAAVLLVTVLCLVWFLSEIDLEVVRVSLEGMRWRYIAATLVAYVVVHAFRSLRLQALVGHGVSFAGVFSVNCIGYLAINVVPLRLGEFVRPYLLLEQHGVPFGASLAGVFIERLLDLTSLLVMLLLVTWVVALPEGGVIVGGVDVVHYGQIVAGTVVAVGAAGLAAIVLGGERLIRLVASLTGWLPVLGEKLPGFLASFQAGARELAATPRRAAWVLLNTVAMWTTQVGGVWLCLRAFDGLPSGWGAALTNWSITLSGMTVAPTPGFFGSFEAFCAAGLALYGVNLDLAQTFAVVNHLTLFGFTVGIGLLFLFKEGLSLGAVIRQSREASV